MPPMEVSRWVQRMEKDKSGSGGSREDVPTGTGGMDFRKPGAEFEQPLVWEVSIRHCSLSACPIAECGEVPSPRTISSDSS